MYAVQPALSLIETEKSSQLVDAKKRLLATYVNVFERYEIKDMLSKIPERLRLQMLPWEDDGFEKLGREAMRSRLQASAVKALPEHAYHKEVERILAMEPEDVGKRYWNWLLGGGSTGDTTWDIP